MITSTQALSSACEEFAQSEFITIDTEFLRETTFWPELCLIQLATPERAIIVDPMADGIDLSPFFALMGDASVVKVFHAARQDIEIIFHRGGLIPHPIFDTQVAAMVCGFGDSVSYDNLVARVTGHQIDKTSRFTDWSRRPLSQKQLEYALADVTHLRDVYLHLSQELKREGRVHWLKEEMDVLEARETYDLHPDDAWTRLRMRVKKPQELAILKAVAAWREREARARNVPRRRVLKDESIYEIAQQAPRDAEAMSRLRTIQKGWERSQAGRAVLEAVQAALDIPKEDLPRLQRSRTLPEGTGAATELLKVLLKLITEREGVASKIIANTDDLEKIAVSGRDAEVSALKGWRREMFGNDALALVEGRLALRFADRRVETLDVS